MEAKRVNAKIGGREGERKGGGGREGTRAGGGRLTE